MAEIAIVVVTHNSGAEIGACLDAAIATGAEILVVDNASRDNTVQEVTRRSVALIANPTNRGFAAAVNQGIQHVTAPLIVLLNPDAVLETGLETLAAACRREGAAGAGGMLTGADGQPQRGFMLRRFPTAAALICEALLVNRAWHANPVNWHYRCLDVDHLAPCEVEQPAGAFLMLRRDAWEALGGFDEGFFPIWFEDVDFCKRAVEHGYHLYYVPDAVAKHTGGHSIPQLTVEKRRLYWYGSCLRYTGKHFRPVTARLVSAGVFLGAFLRAVAESVGGLTVKPVRVYVKVMRLAAHRFVSPRAV